MVDYGEDFISRIVGVHWRKKEVPEPPSGEVYPPKYVAMGGITGELGTVMFLRLDEKTGDIIRVSRVDPLGYDGYTQILMDNPAHPPVPSPSVSAANVASRWKGYDVFGAIAHSPINLYSEAVLSAGEEIEFVADKAAIYDYLGGGVEPVAPPKGVLCNGLWVTSSSVAKYDNLNELVWKRNFDIVYEVLSEYRVLAASYPSPGYGLHTLDPDNGAVVSFQIIGSGGLVSHTNWDTCSNGTTFMGFETIEEVDLGTGGITISSGAKLQAIGLNNNVLWERSLEKHTIYFPAGEHLIRSRFPTVIENSNGAVFFFVPRPSFNFDTPTSISDYTSLIDVYDSNGSVIATWTWGISFFPEPLEDGSLVGEQLSELSDIVSTSRFPPSL